MIRVAYDEGLDPPAPVLPLGLSLPASGGRLQLAGLLDTGADMTLIPDDVAERHLPVAGTVRVRGVTGDVEDATLYRAEVQIGGMRRVLLVAGLGTEAIVGRDLLNSLVVNLDGPARHTTVQPSAA